ncbi:hypothetical protein A3A54_00685 [Candidatus Curtissbacteria bacterium RIFCSPLOWO2_01_FULL_39_62]|uniref:Uncharacterized protein n=2 Tax=Candidatus Curtissiibacteriota TaxID=1752717 RepID=A0A1F5G7J2_9BACT|nr:MAG: hypothetical protein A2775_02620 [Candidatus Curtissbacteria bacterium RIFCSPHIGHO2_01_FULL_39_57]OGD87832.1 MAG: hypothetical protein A3D04_02590 [Candidatus Curtissbacteria bacterium RIFCSPHIGHO2_02_FULL_40_16b]OGD90585.1 MAG: hypothetical protein A3E11_02110 [Candidatus Curtissbacteria bacterium RIFCSPHIGHO2_12_FULL_38_37]OGD99798.1 MAG: hypothetical protein A3J17_04415 [Candidatus Curtissbacteria bacterium RIFCSPLOWO2_02_FULL_40_11]OGE01095.1 MAG: hypothetical protein A3A54_00685 [C
MAPVEFYSPWSRTKMVVDPGKTESLTVNWPGGRKGRPIKRTIEIKCEEDDLSSTISTHVIEGRTRIQIGSFEIGFVPEAIDDRTKESWTLEKGRSATISIEDFDLLKVDHK